jgi:hypothetical protein
VFVDVAVDGSRLMEVTAPGAELVAPCGVTSAFWPTRTLAIDASGTSTVTSTAPVPTMTMFVLALEVPFTKLSEPTVPSIDDVRVAVVRLACAMLSASWAVVMVVWSEMTRDAVD